MTIDFGARLVRLEEGTDVMHETFPSLISSAPTNPLALSTIQFTEPPLWAMKSANFFGVSSSCTTSTMADLTWPSAVTWYQLESPEKAYNCTGVPGLR